MRKKRKAGSQPAKTAVPAARSARLPGGRIVWILPVFGALALVFSWLAALGGSLADGPVDARYFFQGDTFIPYGVFRDLFLDDGYSASGWLYGSAPYYFLDFAFQWALFALGLEPPLALWLFPLLQVAFAAAGWILVCDFLFGKSPVRRTAVLLLHAATFLHLAWFENGLFMLQMTGTWRYGTWACVPWLLWLALRALNAPPGKTAPPANFAALAAAVAVVVASDLVIAPWLLAPAAALSLFFVRPQVAGIFILALGAGTVTGRALAAAAPVEHHEGLALSFDSDRIVRNLRLLHFYLGRIVDFNPMEFLLLPIFAAALVWRAVGEFIPGGKTGRKDRGEFRPIRFVLALLPLSAACTVAAVGVNGLSPVHNLHPVQDVRYALPIVYFPLFIGWALLPFPAPALPAKKAVFAASAAACLLALPQAAKIDFAAMDPFETPFQKCFAENAKRRGWSGVIAPTFYALPMFVNPDAGIENYINSYVSSDGASGERAFVANNFIANWRRMSGEFQVVAVSAHQGRLFVRPPIRGEGGCPTTDPACVRTHTAPGGGIPFYDGAVRAAFGDPAEIVECAGVGLYHYDPPLRFEFSAKPDGKTLGRKF